MDAGGDPVLSDILHAAMFEQLCEKIMVTTFDPDTQPLPSWLTDRTLLQLCAPTLLYSSIALWQPTLIHDPVSH